MMKSSAASWLAIGEMSKRRKSKCEHGEACRKRENGVAKSG
jgi:hypothetical protein